MDKTNEFGNNLRRLIKARGYKTFQKAADAFDITLSYLNQLMRSERHPSIEVLNRISAELGVSANDLLGGESEISHQSQSKSDLIVDLVGVISTMDEPKLHRLLSLARYLDGLSDLGSSDDISLDVLAGKKKLKG